MKKLLRTTLILSLISTAAFSQIPNQSFEFWTNSLPLDWTTNSVVPFLPVSQSTDAWAGTYAIKGQVINAAGQALPPTFYTTATSGPGFAITTTPEFLTGWYKASLIGSDKGLCVVTIYDMSSAAIGVGYIQLPSAANYTLFTVPIIYQAGGTGAYAMIQFAVADSATQTGTIGSNILIDDLAFTGTASVKEVNKTSFSIQSNPVSNQVNINGNFKAGEIYHVLIYDENGKVALNSTASATSNGLSPVDVSSLQEGNYMVSISGTDKSSAQKIIISR